MLRPTYFAGPWYPANRAACEAAILEHTGEAVPDATGARALIGPHAGWRYSGRAAAKSYAALARANPMADLVVVFGSHRGPDGPSTVFLGDGWDTPLGPLRNAEALAERLRRELQLEEEPVEPRRPDNAVELHLPFIKHTFPRAELLVLGVEASERALAIGQHTGEVAAERAAVFVGSSDLTHYGPNYDFAPRGDGPEAVRWVRDTNDAGFLARVLADDPGGALEHARRERSACCPGAVAACMTAVAVAGKTVPKLVEHYLSCDVQPSDSFVGYAGIVI